MFKKKGSSPVKAPVKKEAEEALEESFFSSPEGEDFFKEPELGGGAESDDGNAAAFEDKPVSDDVADESFDDIEDFDDELEETDAGGWKKKLLLLLLLVAVGYLAYAYVIPQYFPDLFGPASSGTQVAQRSKIPKRVPIKTPAPSVPKVEKTAAAPAPPPVVEKPEKVVPGPIPGKPHEVMEVKPENVARESVIEKVDAVGGEPEELPAHPVEIPEMVEGDIQFVTAALPVAEKNMYFVQTGVYMFKGNVKGPEEKIRSLGYTPRVEAGRKVVNMSRLTVGHWSDAAKAAAVAARLKGEGYDARVIDLEGGGYSVLIGSYYYENVANEEKIILEAKGYEAALVKKPISMKVHHVLVGPYGTPGEAAAVDAKLKSAGLKTVILQSR